MHIETKKLSELKPADYNPRMISEGARRGLQASIQRFGLVEPIIWNKKTGHIVGGHQRFGILMEEGATETEVVVVDLGEADEKALNLALNNPAIAGEFTLEVNDIIAELQDFDPDIVSDLQLESIIKKMPELDLDDPDDDDGNTGPQMDDYEYRIIITCNDEDHQRLLLEKFTKDGYEARALIS